MFMEEAYNSGEDALDRSGSQSIKSLHQKPFQGCGPEGGPLQDVMYHKSCEQLSVRPPTLILPPGAPTKEIKNCPLLLLTTPFYTSELQLRPAPPLSGMPSSSPQCQGVSDNWIDSGGKKNKELMYRMIRNCFMEG